MLATPWIKDYVNATRGANLDWHVALAVCSVGLTIGLLTVGALRKTIAHIGSPPDALPLDVKKLLAVLAGGVVAVAAAAVIPEYQALARAFVYVAGIVVLGSFFHLIRSSAPSERAGLIAALVLTLQTVFFFIFYQQMSTSLALFALRNVDLEFTVLGSHLWTWSPAQFQALNAIWIMVLSPVLAFIYTRAANRGRDLSIAAKLALGFAVVAAGFFTYGVAGQFAVVDPLQTLPVYTHLFNKLGIAAIVCTLIALAALPLMRRLTATHHSHQ